VKFLFNILRADVTNVIPHMERNIFLNAAERFLLCSDAHVSMLFVQIALISRQWDRTLWTLCSPHRDGNCDSHS
jgi:hypothetical protein